MHHQRLIGACSQGVGRKLNTPLLFDAHLDMRPYLSSTVLLRRLRCSGNRAGWGTSARQFMYDLYAVVCHSGNLQVRACSGMARLAVSSRTSCMLSSATAGELQVRAQDVAIGLASATPGKYFEVTLGFHLRMRVLSNH